MTYSEVDDINYAIQLLEHLVDKYEKSKSFSGDNKVTQSFAVKPEKLFKAYGDHSNYDIFNGVNEAIRELVALGYVTIMGRGSVITKIQLEVTALNEVYSYLARTPKEWVQGQLNDLFIKYEGENELINAYLEVQKTRLAKNQKIQGYKGDLKDYEDLMLAISSLLKLPSETYERDFSVRLFSDSKKFKSLESRIISILYDYGDYPNKEGILGELNLLKNPTYVYVKGAGIIDFGKQSLDLSVLPSDIAISSENLAQVTSIEVTGGSIITVENLTSFHKFNQAGSMVVYLGGFHNRAKRIFLKQIYHQNSGKKFLHFGDIDIGGILILEHLRRKTNIPFEPFEMTIDNLIRYKGMTQPLTENDRKRAIGLLDTSWEDLVEYMIKHGCKLEQEAIDI